MGVAEIKSEISRLPICTRLELLFEVWDELAEEPDAVSLTADQKKELDRRYQRHLANPAEAERWDEVRAQITRRPKSS